MLEKLELQELTKIAGERCVVSDAAECLKRSHDYYWFSPRLEQQYRELSVDAVVSVEEVEVLKKIVAFCVRRGIAINIRGGATGNFGQILPLAGGIMIDVSALNKILQWKENSVILQAGVKCQLIENEARARGLEMLCYPSTWMKATIGGFACGGSGGVGGMSHGLLHQNHMVCAAKVLTIEEEPRVVELEGGEACLPLLHSFGALGILIELEIRLTPKYSWEQVMVTGQSIEAVLQYGIDLAKNWDWSLRMMGFLQAPLPHYCLPIKKYLQTGEHALFFEVRSEQVDALLKQVEGSDGLRVAHRIAHQEPKRPPMLSDFIQGHSILWAKKGDKRLTSCAVFIDFDNWQAQLKKINEELADDFSMQVDFHRHRGQGTLFLQSSLLYPYQNDADLQRRLDYFEREGMTRFNVHDPFVESKLNPEMLAKKKQHKREWDPLGLLNPGKIRSHPVNPFAGNK